MRCEVWAPVELQLLDTLTEGYAPSCRPDETAKPGASKAVQKAARFLRERRARQTVLKGKAESEASEVCFGDYMPGAGDAAHDLAYALKSVFLRLLLSLLLFTGLYRQAKGLSSP